MYMTMGRLIRRILARVLAVVLFVEIAAFLLVPVFHSRQYAGMVYRNHVSSGRISDPVDLPAGERFRLIETDEDALEWRLRAIEAARHSIVISTFDFEDNDGGRLVMAYLLHAAERGVRVEILLDGFYGFFNTFGEEHFKALVKDPNIRIYKYNKVNAFLLYKSNYRMHDKYIIIDDKLYLLGGRNLSSEFLGDFTDKKHSLDRDILIYEPKRLRGADGTSLQALQNYWNSIRVLPTCKEYRYTRHSRKVERAADTLRALYRDYAAMHPYEKTHWDSATSEAESVRLISGERRPVNKEPLVFAQLYHEMEAGKDVLIQSPYIVCSTAMFRDLTFLTFDRERRISILTNAPESGANPWGSMDLLNNRRLFLQSGCELYELFNSDSMHTKTILIDDDLSIIGSYNLDSRATYLDTEMMAAVRSKELNAELRETLQKDIDHSVHYDRAGRKTLGKDCVPRKLQGPRRFFYRIGRVVLPLFRQLL